MTASRQPHWEELADPGVQQERTALAWERTAISTMVVGTLLARVAAQERFWVFAGFGILYIAVGGLTLIWTSRHYLDLHSPITGDEEVVHPRAARVLGAMTISLTATATIVAALPLLPG